MPTPKVSNDELQLDVDAYVAAGGNISEAARMRKIHRITYHDRLKMAEDRLGLKLGKIVDGRLEHTKAKKRPLPKGKGVARYFLSSVQNNTHPHHAGLRGVEAYSAWLAKLPGCTSEIIVGSFSYSIDAYGAKAVKRGTKKSQGQLWYAPELEPYIRDEPIQLAPGLIWAGEMNILPTAKFPLTGLADYNGRNSNIFPHVKQHMESVASLADEATKFNYSTGTLTQRNYIQKRAGIMAERWHTYGALLVEVDSEGNWYVRQLQVDDSGVIYDIGPNGYSGVRIADGKVEAIKPNGKTFVEAVAWGDIHSAEMDLEVRRLGWSKGGMLDQLRPRMQFMHDVFSMRSRSHHEMKNFHRTFQKYVDGESSVSDELQVTADFMGEASRPWCETIVVRSNHDRHLDRWLNEANPAFDPQNALLHTRLQAKLLTAIVEGDRDFNILESALRDCGLPEDVLFLGEDESFVICKKHNGGIECGLHGDLGPNGARGSTQALLRLARPTNKMHDHTAAIRGPVYSGGACSLHFPYMKGPHAHSVSHIINFENAARQIVTMWQGKFRA